MKTKSAALVVIAASGAAAAQVTTFDDGTEGWSVSGRDNVSQDGGNPGAHLDVFLRDVFGADTRNSTPPFVGDFRDRGTLTFTVDVQIDSISFLGSEVERELIVQLRRWDSQGNGSLESIWAPLGIISAADTGEWTTFSIDLDTSAVAPPPGWFGSNPDDPFSLPPGMTVQDVLADTRELAFTTFVPGMFFGFTDFDMSVDNVGIIPAPGTLALLGLGGVVAARRRRQVL